MNTTTVRIASDAEDRIGVQLFVPVMDCLHLREAVRLSAKSCPWAERLIEPLDAAIAAAAQAEQRHRDGDNQMVLGEALDRPSIEQWKHGVPATARG